MGKKRKQRGNPVVKARMEQFARDSGFEIVEYKHITVDLLRVAYVSMKHLATLPSQPGVPLGIENPSTGMKIVVRRVTPSAAAPPDTD